ncbi:MAG: hypothetical protein NZ700_18235 [Gemmataceae bacterium]|nr:hypothetical protein [Gemmataceae bacterium]MDW8265475.1 hypothetical protein [Gemmataceae bacterium]
MRDPFSWSLPLGRVWGILVRVHILFPLVALGLILRAASAKGALPDTWIDATMLMALLFVAVLLHELGHCFGARQVEGEANEILIWPLGGLANVDVPHTPRANLITTAAGPLVNLLLGVGSAVLLLWATDFAIRPPWNPLWYPLRSEVVVTHDGTPSVAMEQVVLRRWDGAAVGYSNLAVVILARFCWVNWCLFLLNTLLIGFPLDGGRLLQCLLWPHWGFRQATLAAVFAGFVTALILGIVSFATNEVLLLALALFIYVTCRQQWIVLETGGEESLFGYDFSQGYASLEQEPAPPKPSFWQRWQQRRAARRLQREQEQREQEERRMDELLQKVQMHGLAALTDEERRFLNRVSARYRNRR